MVCTGAKSEEDSRLAARKYARIVALLLACEKAEGGGGGEPSGSEAAKFRLWVKTKSFHLGPPAGHRDYGKPECRELLYLPGGTDKVS